MNVFVNLLFWSYLTTFVLNKSVQALKAEKIIGGHLATAKKYRFNVFVKIGEIGSCSGAIIGPKSVVTAAHCLYDGFGTLRSRKLKVIAGIADIKDMSNNREEINVAKIFTPLNFTHEFHRLFLSVNTEFEDIAVLKLEKSLKVTSKLKLPQGNSIYNGRKVTVFGFGSKSMDREKEHPTPIFDGKLRLIDATVLHENICYNILYRHMEIDNYKEYLCAELIQNTADIGNTCVGDSGGPMVYDKNILIGIVSLGDPYCNNRHSSFTRITSYKSFLQKSINDKPDDTMRCEPLITYGHCTIM